MTINKLVKSVSFNVTNETDALILKAIKRRKNFSGYVKKLLLADIQSVVKAEVVEVKQTPSDRLAKLKEQMNSPKLTD
jgi:hypothetical protein